MYFNDNYLYIIYLGEGGFGRVALAKDVLADRLVAIKWLKENDSATIRFYQGSAFQVEAPNFVENAQTAF